MLIKLPDIINTEYKEFCVGQRKRLATASGCCFISENIIAINHLVGQRLYLVYFDMSKNEYQIISQIDTTFEYKKCPTELVTTRNNIIATSNFYHSISTYKITDYKIYKLDDYHFQNFGYCHGIKYYTNNIICFTTMLTPNNVCFFDLINRNILYKFDHQIGRPKDICFISDNQMIIIYTCNDPSGQPYKLMNSYVHLVQFNIEDKNSKIISEFIISDCQLDACVFHKGLIYIVTVKDAEDSVQILKIENDTLTYHDQITGFNIPHGLSIQNNLFAVTNYCDNTVKIMELSS